MKKEFHGGRVILHGGDSMQVIETLPENSIDAIVCDPPYALVSITKRFGKDGAAPAKSDGATGVYMRASSGFMGKTWDTGEVAFNPEFWAKVLRVLKPGGHLVAFSGCRTYHHMTVAIEDAGFQVREMLAWTFGSGFPKSHDISKALDRMAGAEREVIFDGASGKETETINAYGNGLNVNFAQRPITAPATDAARQWAGWGTALKPSFEPICLARKPLSEGTVAANVLRWGTGALNIDATRVGNEGGTTKSEQAPYSESGWRTGHQVVSLNAGRWPATLIHDGSEEVLAGFPQTKSGSWNGQLTGGPSKNTGMLAGKKDRPFFYEGDEGSAARFFYTAKANELDRQFSKHPTVKPVSLMRWLVRMVTPPGGTVLDPFAGTGTTGHAALLEGFNAVLFEREAEYQADIARRMELVFAGQVERAKHAKQDTHETLPLFGAAE